MDGHRFDTLTRALAASDGATPRRGFLKAVAAGLTAAALGRAATGTTTGTCFQLP